MVLVWLMWKGFREHVWKMLALAGIIVPTVLAGSIGSQAWQQYGWQALGEMAWLWGVWLAPIWLAAFTISGERTRNTEATLAVLPVRKLTVFAVRTFWGAAAFLIPLGFSLWIGAGDLFRGDEPYKYIGLMAGGLTLYTLIVALGLNISREGMAAMAGVLILLICGVWFMTAETLVHRWLVSWLLVLNPFGICYVTMDSQNTSLHPYAGIGMQGIVAALYWLIGAVRYQRQAARLPREKNQDIEVAHLIAPLTIKTPFRHPLLWKERREQTGLIIAAAIGGVGLAILFVIIRADAIKEGSLLGWGGIHNTLGMLSIMGIFIPAAVAGILGISSMSSDAEKKVSEFWRSRSIRPGYLFWAKYGFALVGVGILATFFELPYFVLAPIIEAWYPSLNHFRTIDWGADVLFRQLVGLWLCLSLACLLGVIIRRSLYGAIFLIVAVVLIMFCPLGGHTTVGDVFLGDRLPQWLFAIVMGVVFLTAACTVLARVAFGRGWRVG